jgi:Spy/CpxP family protein refolding chaperone
MTAHTQTRRLSPLGLPHPVQMLLATLVVAAAAGLAPTAHAQPVGPMAGGPGGLHSPGLGGHGMGRMLDKVNATADQRAKIKAILDAARADLKPTIDAGRTLHQQLQTVFAQANIDARAVETLRQQIQANHDTASKRLTQAHLDAANVLTPEQRKTLADLLAKHQALAQRHAAERANLDKAPQ